MEKLTGLYYPDYALKVGTRFIKVPRELVDHEEFVITVFAKFPNIKTTKSYYNPFVFEKPGMLKEVVRSMSSYDQIERVAKRAGVKKDIANAVGQMFIHTGAIDSIQFINRCKAVVSHPDFKTDPDRLWRELRAELVDEWEEVDEQLSQLD